MTTENVLNPGESYRKLSEQAALLPGCPSTSTLWRWANDGIGGARLETVRVGRTVFASDEAIQRFLTAINQTTHRGRELVSADS